MFMRMRSFYIWKGQVELPSPEIGMAWNDFGALFRVIFIFELDHFKVKVTLTREVNVGFRRNYVSL